MGAARQPLQNLLAARTAKTTQLAQAPRPEISVVPRLAGNGRQPDVLIARFLAELGNQTPQKPDRFLYAAHAAGTKLQTNPPGIKRPCLSLAGLCNFGHTPQV